MRYPLAVIALLALAATACLGGRYRYTAYRHIPTGGWAYGERLVYDVALADSAESGDLLLDITHDNSYPYSNLWLEMKSGGVTDTFCIDLCDATGHWYGRGLEGHYQLEVPVRRAVTLRDSSRIILRHIMRVDTLRGISQVGLTLARQ